MIYSTLHTVFCAACWKCQEAVNNKVSAEHLNWWKGHERSGALLNVWDIQDIQPEKTSHNTSKILHRSRRQTPYLHLHTASVFTTAFGWFGLLYRCLQTLESIQMHWRVVTFFHVHDKIYSNVTMTLAIWVDWMVSTCVLAQQRRHQLRIHIWKQYRMPYWNICNYYKSGV